MSDLPKVSFDEKTAAFLKRPLFGKIATLRRSGAPHVTPIWYMYEDGKLIINTTTDRVKYKNIRHDPRVCFIVDDGYPYVKIEGNARIATERDPKKDIESLAIRYQGEEEGRKAARERFWKMDRISLEIIPERLFVDL